jgi:hypothetical protein
MSRQTGHHMRWLIGCGALLGVLATPEAAAVDWATVQNRTVTVFQTGQSSWGWLLTPGDHGTAPVRRIREGETCLSCHADEERAIGSLIVSGQKLEPNPLSGMPAAFDVDVRVAREGDNLHVRFAWTSPDGAGWAGDDQVPAQVTFLLADDTLGAARIAGCWAACHGDMRGMPSQLDAEMTHYLPNSRTGMTAIGGGRDLRSADELAAELQRGAFYEFWQVELTGDGLQRVLDGYMLEARRDNADSEVRAEARREAGGWVVEMIRPLRPSGGPRKTLDPAREYTVAIAIHENSQSGRRHFVAFPMQMSFTRADAELTVGAR